MSSFHHDTVPARTPANDGKLVRDRIPEIIRAAGGNPDTRILSDDQEYLLGLRSKLREEVEELLGSTGEGLTEELADTVEVLMAMAEAVAITWPEVERTRQAKREKRGGFTARMWLMSPPAAEPPP